MSFKQLYVCIFYIHILYIYIYICTDIIYVYIYIKEYLHVHKITLNENEMPTPLIKHTFICWTRLKTEKLLATALQLIRKNYVSCLKNQTCFVHSLNVQISSTPSPCSFLLAFYWLLHLFPRKMAFLNGSPHTEIIIDCYWNEKFGFIDCPKLIQTFRDRYTLIKVDGQDREK